MDTVDGNGIIVENLYEAITQERACAMFLYNKNSNVKHLTNVTDVVTYGNMTNTITSQFKLSLKFIFVILILYSAISYRTIQIINKINKKLKLKN